MIGLLEKNRSATDSSFESVLDLDTRRKLNVHKTFRRRPGRFLNVLRTFNLRPVSMEVTIRNCFELEETESFQPKFLVKVSLFGKPANNYLFKFNKKNTRSWCEICSKLTMKTQERHQRCRSGVFIVNFEHISQLFLVFLLLTLKK